MRRLGSVFVLLLAAGVGLAVGGARASAQAGPAEQTGEEIIVFAAASLKNALDNIAMAWRKETGRAVTMSFAASARHARQIQQGAPADLFISANVKWVDVLADEKLIDGRSRRNIVGNTLVLVAHGKSAPGVAIAQGFDLAGLLKGGKLAMAMVDTVPAGIYGKAALSALGAWDAVAQNVAQADNVRAALALVARGEAPFGIVYATDAAASDNVTIAGRFPDSSHPPIIYPAAVVAESGRKAAAQAFLDYLSSNKARLIFEQHGFAALEPAMAN